MTANGDLFYDDATQTAVTHYHELVELWNQSLDKARPNNVVELPSSGFPQGLRGVVVALKSPVDLPHSGWLYQSISSVVPRESVSRLVGVGSGSTYKRLTQSSAIGATDRLYVIATGVHAEALLRAAIQAEASFNRDNFDQDGYTL
jgi:hypothetical protein